MPQSSRRDSESDLAADTCRTHPVAPLVQRLADANRRNRLHEQRQLNWHWSGRGEADISLSYCTVAALAPEGLTVTMCNPTIGFDPALLFSGRRGHSRSGGRWRF